MVSVVTAAGDFQCYRWAVCKVEGCKGMETYETQDFFHAERQGDGTHCR